MSDTPRTDALAERYEHLPLCAAGAIWLHARELERESAARIAALRAIAATFPSDEELKWYGAKVRAAIELVRKEVEAANKEVKP